MANLPVRQMMTLVEPRGHREFPPAAERLKLSQPAVSTHIRDLEALFRRAVGVPDHAPRLADRGRQSAGGPGAQRAFEELEMASQDRPRPRRSPSRPRGARLHSADDGAHRPQRRPAARGRISGDGYRDSRRAVRARSSNSSNAVMPILVSVRSRGRPSFPSRACCATLSWPQCRPITPWPAARRSTWMNCSNIRW